MLLQPYKTNNYKGLLLIGEAAGESEEKKGLPFVGASGKLLDNTLEELSFQRDFCGITNVFMKERPPSNKINHFFIGIRQANNDLIKICKDVPKYQGQYLKEQYRDELIRLGEEIKDFNPGVIVAMGNTALWGLVGISGITSARGEFLFSKRYQREVLPTFHPAAVIRDRKNKLSLFKQDLRKAIEKLTDSKS